MPSPETIRMRIALIHKFEQLAARLEAGDQTAVEEAKDRLAGLALCNDAYTLALIFRALSRVLDEMQGEIDRGGWKYGEQNG